MYAKFVKFIRSCEMPKSEVMQTQHLFGSWERGCAAAYEIHRSQIGKRGELLKGEIGEVDVGACQRSSVGESRYY
jgi:hypothetical protein